MRQKYLSTLFISILLLLLVTTVVSAAGDKINVTYVAYAPSDAMEQASQTNQYSGFIDYTYINAYNATYYASDDLLAAAESGFLGRQDVILFDMVGSNVYKTKSNTIDNILKQHMTVEHHYLA